MKMNKIIGQAVLPDRQNNNLYTFDNSIMSFLDKYFSYGVRIDYEFRYF